MRALQIINLDSFHRHNVEMRALQIINLISFDRHKTYACTSDKADLAVERERHLRPRERAEWSGCGSISTIYGHS